MKNRSGTPARPFWQRPCPAWCHGRHTGHESSPDRECISTWQGRLVLTTMDVVIHSAWAGTDHWWAPRTLISYVVRGYRETEPRVEIEDEFGPQNAEAGRVALSLTLDEARTLARQLTKAVELAEDGAR